MKISKNTLNMMKNFSDINMSIEVKAGNTLRTVSVQKNILAQTDIEETFPQDFAIYDLSRFLSAASLFDNPDFVFGEKTVRIGTDNDHINYVYCDPSMIVTPPENNITVPDAEVKFRLTQSNLDKILKRGNVLSLPEISVECNGGSNDRIVMRVIDSSNDSSDAGLVDLSATGSSKFQFIFKIENFKMIPADYDVEISSKGISKFSFQGKTQYWVANETSSTYGG